MELHSASLSLSGHNVGATSGGLPPDEEEPHIIRALHERGFAHFEPDEISLEQFEDRGAMHDVFERGQQLDPEPGNRWRSRGAVSLARLSGAMEPMPAGPYIQSPDYNPDDGGKERTFAPIAHNVLLGPTVRWIAQRNVRLASILLPDVAAADFIAVDVHLISYRPTRTEAAFSSPIWLHRDDERLVSVTIFNVSENLGGGENILSPGGRAINAIINMRRSMETLFLTHKGLHGVFPMYSKDGKPAFRNILIASVK